MTLANDEPEQDKKEYVKTWKRKTEQQCLIECMWQLKRIGDRLEITPNLQ